MHIYIKSSKANCEYDIQELIKTSEDEAGNFFDLFRQPTMAKNSCIFFFAWSVKIIRYRVPPYNRLVRKTAILRIITVLSWQLNWTFYISVLQVFRVFVLLRYFVQHYWFRRRPLYCLFSVGSVWTARVRLDFVWCDFNSDRKGKKSVKVWIKLCFRVRYPKRSIYLP